MRSAKYVFLLVLGAFTFAQTGFTQERFQAHVDFTMGFPQDEFKTQVDGTAYGGSGYFLYRLPRSPLAVGLSFGVMVYGSEGREEPFSWSIPEVWVDVRTRNYMLNSHVMLRFQPSYGYLRPYVDALFGMNYIWTQTSIYDQGNFDRDAIASEVLWDDTSLSYGLGGGIMIRVLETRRMRTGAGFAMDLDFGFRYLKGGNAEYMTEGSIVQVGNQVEYLVSESRTDLVSAHMGLTFMF